MADGTLSFPVLAREDLERAMALRVTQVCMDPYPPFTLPCAPLVAVYGAQAYAPAMPLLGVVGPAEPLDPRTDALPPALPAGLVEAGAAAGWTALHTALWVHSAPTYQQCQKFLCDSHDHVNLMFHTWALAAETGATTIDPSTALNIQVTMGVFDPVGVVPVHQDLVDSGAPVGAAQPRSVVLHDGHFSPENAMVSVEPSSAAADLAVFWSLGVHGSGAAAATLHILPLSDKTAARLDPWISAFVANPNDPPDTPDPHTAPAIILQHIRAFQQD